MPNIVMFVVTIAKSLGISAYTVSKEGGNHADVSLCLLPKLRTIINELLNSPNNTILSDRNEKIKCMF